MNKDIEFTIETNGFYGVYHQGNRKDDVVIIRVAGSGAKKENVLSCSQFLFDAGYNVLCLGYYMWGNLGNTIDEIPIDYVEKAIQWIKQYKNNPNLKVGMTGMSQGANYTLAAASLLPDINSIVAVSPFDYVMEGTTTSFKRTGHSSYTYHNYPLPYTRWKLLDKGIISLLWNIIRDKNYGISRMLRYGYDKNGIEESSAIQIENMHANVLFLASKNDDCWPADEATNRMIKRLKENNYTYIVESYIYEKGCHNMGGNMTITGKTGKKIRKMMKSWADHPQDCIACIEDSKIRILDFFERTL